MRRTLLYPVTLFVACALALAGYYAERINNERHAADERAMVLSALTRVKDALDTNLTSDIQLVRGLVGVIALDPKIDQARFDRVVRPLFANQHQLRNIAVAEGSVIRLVYPLAGNEKALGADYRKLPAQFVAVDRARQTRQIVVAGPVNLVQGGIGLIPRLPVFLTDESGEDRYWGIISAVIDVDKLFERSGLLANDARIDIAIRGRDASGPSGEVFWGDPGVFERSPITIDMPLPEGSWQLAAIPRGGWTPISDNQWLLRLGFATLTVMVVGVLAWLIAMLGRVEQASQVAEAARRRLAGTLESTPNVAVQWYDRDGVVTYWNRASETLFGWTADEARGQRLDQLMLTAGESATFSEALVQLAENGEAIGPMEFTVKTREGETRWVESSLFCIPGHSGDEPIYVCMDVDISERKRAQRALADFNRDFEAFLDQTTDFIYFKDAESRFRFCSQTLADITGHSDWRKMLGKHDREVFPPDTARIYEEEEEPVFATGRPLLNRIDPYYDDEGNRGYVSTNKWPLFDEQRKVVGIFGISRDITERIVIEEELRRHRHQLEEIVAQRTMELEEARRVAEEASAAKSIFLANMSHEIRTPLNAITGMAHLIRRGALSPEQAERLTRLELATDHLLDTINAILDLTKIEAGKVTLEEDGLSIDTVLANVSAMMRDRALAKHLEFAIQCEPDLPRVLGDVTRLQQALLNFIGNAIKFTDAGFVRVSARRIAEDAHTLEVRFAVEDSGIGIPPDRLASLFQAFEQGDNSITRRFGGTGLGLALTRKLAQLMDGDAGATSVEGQGSTFWLTARLKKHQSDAPAIPTADTSGEDACALIRERFPGARVLLVEDEPINQEIAIAMLDEAGLIVEAADDGREALQRVANNDYELILMDMQMPGMDGLTATLQLRTTERGQGIPIIAMTANAFSEDRQRCLAAGMNDFIAKPVDPPHLFAVLLKWLAQSSS